MPTASLASGSLTLQNWRAPLTLLLTLLMCAGCNPTRELLDTIRPANQPPANARSYALYLVGDAGLPPDNPENTALGLLKTMLDAEGPNSAVVFLGDNLYPSGLPAQETPGRAEGERRLDALIHTVSEHLGQVVFVPGNHDWGSQGLGGDRAALRRQEEYLEDAIDKGNTFLPDQGLAGPIEVSLNDEITLVAIDTQWWLEPNRPFGNTESFNLDQMGRVLTELEDVLLRNEGKKLIVVGHHPVYSKSEHGGFFNAPMSPVSFIRRFLGTPQDFSNFAYRRLRKGLRGVFEQHDHLIYAAGHDHSLQYLPRNTQHYIVSGSSTKTSYAAAANEGEFTSSHSGFGRLMFYTDGSVWLEFWRPADNGDGERIHATLLLPANRPLIAYQLPTNVEGDLIIPEETAVVFGEASSGNSDEISPLPDASSVPYVFVTQDTVTIQAGDYDIPSMMNLALGKRYRKLWSTPVDIPVIDLNKTAGGLTPIKKGGGFQTTSLRLKGADGDQYVLRSVNKDASAVLPRFLRDTVADDFIEDQTSAMHPFGAFSIPPLADAASIYHTEPRLVVIPDDERLGIYREELAGIVALFESRPNNPQRDELRFGQPEDIIGSDKLFEKLLERNEHRVDARFFARSRLFDMWVGDWDRHQDQWRWAAFEPGELDHSLSGKDRTRGKTYRPIPRNRDFVYFKPGGLISDIAQWVGGPRLKLSKFGPHIKSMKGLNFSASNLDKQFTAPLNREDWVTIAKEIQAGLTDDVIEQAIQRFPPSAFEETGPSIIANLKIRRNHLVETAERYYEMLARKVEIVGSNEDEEFVVTRAADGTVEIAVYRLSPNSIPEKELFRRIFFQKETKEVHLYGLGGVDRFTFDGEGKSNIVVRAVGGYGTDTFNDQTRGSARTLVYETPGQNAINTQSPTRVYLRADPQSHIYTSKRFGRSNVLPVFDYDLNSEDVVFVGAGFRWIVPGFLESPYHSSHTLSGIQSLFTRAFTVNYMGHFTRAMKEWDGNIDLSISKYHNIRNYYGLGNHSDGSAENRQRFRAQFTEVVFEPKIIRRMTFFRTLTTGLRLVYTNVDAPPNGSQPGTSTSGYEVDDFVEKIYAGVNLSFHVDGTDTLAQTRAGARWNNTVQLNQGIYNTDKRHLLLSSELSYFYAFNAAGTWSLALRVGGSRIIGDFEFHQARFLSGRQNLRGYEKKPICRTQQLL